PLQDARRRREVPRRRDRQHPAIVTTHQLPADLMDQPVVPMAQQNEVVEVGGPAAGPVHEVMRGGPRRRPLATGPAAGAVSRLQGSYVSICWTYNVCKQVNPNPP